MIKLLVFNTIGFESKKIKYQFSKLLYHLFIIYLYKFKNKVKKQFFDKMMNV